MTKLTLNRVIDEVDELPSLPQVVVRVMELTDDPESTAFDIQEVLNQDQSMTAQVLRLANSVYYGYSRRIATVSDAIIMIGFNAVRSIVLAASVSKILKKELKGYVMDEGELWKHSQATAIIARLLAKRVKFRSIELAYTAALLHDIGKLVLNSFMNEAYQEVISIVNEEKLPFNEVEDNIFGYNHATLGGKVAEKWKLPPDLSEAIACHHEPEKAEINPRLTAIVHVADAVTMQMGMGLGIDGLMYPLFSESLELLGLTEHDLEAVMAEIVDLFIDSDTF
jgi:putative nucleotidyltransferase with HDIG domain